MIKLQDQLNKETKPKRDSSFHEDQPRWAAVKCKEGMKTDRAAGRRTSQDKKSSNDKDKELLSKKAAIESSSPCDTHQKKQVSLYNKTL